MVALFLCVLTYALFVFLRGDDFVVHFEVEQRTVLFYQDFAVHGFSRRHEAAVGKSLRIPAMLITAEVCTIITKLIVFGNIFRLFWRRKKRVAKKTKAWIDQHCVWKHRRILAFHRQHKLIGYQGQNLSPEGVA